MSFKYFSHTAIQHSTVINTEIEKVFDWFCINKVSLNINKTKFMVFHPYWNQMNSRSDFKIPILNVWKIFNF